MATNQTCDFCKVICPENRLHLITIENDVGIPSIQYDICFECIGDPVDGISRNSLLGVLKKLLGKVWSKKS